LVLVCALVAVKATSEDDCCSHDDRENVLHHWQAVWSPEFLHRRVTVAQEVFKRFLEHAPEATALFDHVGVADMDSDDFVAHCVRVMNGIDLLLNLAYDPDVLHEHLDHLGAQHAKIEGIKADYFDTFRQTLEEVLPQAIPCFDAEAFERCLNIDTAHIQSMLPA